MNPLNRPMFVSKFNRGGSVYLSPAMRYMQQNPDVFRESLANAQARGLTGKASQAQIERDAELHYAFHGQPEGREYGGRTFLGGLLTPRLGDTFGLTPERRAELEKERDAPPAEGEPVFRGPPGDIPGGFVPLVPIGDFDSSVLSQGPGDGGFSEGGEVMSEEAQRQAAADALNEYQSSPVVQGYLVANPDVLASATRIAQSRGVAPGSEFQRIVENAAREHYRDFGVREGRRIAGYPTLGSPLMLDEVKRLPAPVATTTEPEGIASVPIPPVDPRMLAFANILAKTYDRDDPGTQGGLRPEYVGSVGDIYDLVGDINYNLRDRLIDRFYGDTNEDKLPGRVDDIISYAFRPNTQGDTMFGVAGGNEGLLRAYDQLGITGAGDSYADRQVKDFLDIIRQAPSSSINMDGTGGADQISLGGPTGTGYDSVQQMIADLPNMAQQFAAVPTINPLGILNTLYNMYTGNIMKNPYDTSDATGTRPDRSVPSPMEFGGGMIGNAPLTEQQMQIMDALQFNSPGYPGLVGSGRDSGFAGIQGIKDTPTFT